MKNKLRLIINHYGQKHQQKKLAEEVHELQEALTTFSTDGNIYNLTRNRKHVIEEMGDVFNLLLQIQQYYEISNNEIKEAIEFKVNRQIMRIKNEK